MKEIEAKIIDIDIKSTRNKLKALQAKGPKIIKIDASYFDNGTTDVIRVRQENDITVFTVKSGTKKTTVRTANEYETRVEDAQQMKKALAAMGMKLVATQKKVREEYTLQGAHIIIDTMPGIPPYIEIEAKDEKTIQEIANQLGFQKDQLKSWTGKEVIEHYSRKS